MTVIGGVPVHPSNADQVRAWDGEEGAYWAAHADHFERALAAHRRRFFDAAAIEPNDRVLDVGCGTGGTTRRAARAASAGSVLGVDLSSAMLGVARARAVSEGLTNVRFEQADAQVHPFERASFDVAIGQTSAMFFGDRIAGLANVGRALRSGGRLVLLTWQPFAANEWIQELSSALAAGRELPVPPPGAPGPFTLAEPEVIRAVLSAAGYRDVVLDAATEPMWFGHDAEDAHRLVSGLMAWMLDGLDEAGRTRALGDLRATIDAHETPEGVLYESATWTISASRP
ncbi:MAG TPA: methyltransferase domain-containing protein [Acidimicrobiales bacterium]|nr:methyltransferase domain-containing protein [Acidimicrobiales bacterium]